MKVNVPLLDTIEQVSSYANFLKDLCTKKRAHQAPKKVFLSVNISEIIQNSMPVKYKAPGCLTILCTIRITIIDKALLDLVSSVNLLPYSVYKQLGIGLSIGPCRAKPGPGTAGQSRAVPGSAYPAKRWAARPGFYKWSSGMAQSPGAPGRPVPAQQLIKK